LEGYRVLVFAEDLEFHKLPAINRDPLLIILETLVDGRQGQ